MKTKTVKAQGPRRHALYGQLLCPKCVNQKKKPSNDRSVQCAIYLTEDKQNGESTFIETFLCWLDQTHLNIKLIIFGLISVDAFRRSNRRYIFTVALTSELVVKHRNSYLPQGVSLCSLMQDSVTDCHLLYYALLCRIQGSIYIV